MNLLVLDPDELSADGQVEMSGPRAAHLLEVLDVAPGKTLRVGIVDGPLGIGTVLAIHDRTVALSCSFNPIPPPRPRVDLLLALPRPKVMRRLWAQLAALGVGRIFLTNAERVERHYFDTHILTPACYRPLLIEGLQQARDTRLPIVSIHRRFKVLIEDQLDGLSGVSLRTVADPGSSNSVSEVVSPLLRRTPEARLLLAVGPEGGWNAFELELLHRHGFDRIGMGSRTLRTDTACLALLALAHDALSRPF